LARAPSADEREAEAIAEGILIGKRPAHIRRSSKPFVARQSDSGGRDWHPIAVKYGTGKSVPWVADKLYTKLISGDTAGFKAALNDLKEIMPDADQKALLANLLRHEIRGPQLTHLFRAFPRNLVRKMSTPPGRGRLVAETYRGLLGFDDPAEEVESPPSTSPPSDKPGSERTTKGARQKLESADGNGDSDGGDKSRVRRKSSPKGSSGKSTSKLKSTTKTVAKKGDDLLRKLGVIGTVIDLGLTYGSIVEAHATKEELKKPPAPEKPDIRPTDTKAVVIKKHLTQAARAAAQIRYDVLRRQSGRGSIVGELVSKTITEPIMGIIGGTHGRALDISGRIRSRMQYVQRATISEIEKHVSLSEAEREQIRAAIEDIFLRVEDQLLK
jgi:hypothetical protein